MIVPARLLAGVRLATMRVLFRDETMARIEAADPCNIDRAAFKRDLRAIDALPTVQP